MSSLICVEVALSLKMKEEMVIRRSIRCNGGVLEDQMIDPSLYSAQYSDKILPQDGL